jgi:hypothetical protein
MYVQKNIFLNQIKPMDISKLLDRFNSKKLRPITGMVIAEVMLFLFSIESLIEWFNISPKLFIFFFVLSCIFVFVLIHYIKQPEGERSWIKAMIQPLVYLRTILFLVFFGIIFLLYVATLPPYKVIAITAYEEKQFSKPMLIRFSKQPFLDSLTEELQTFIGPQYRVKVDDNVDTNFKYSRLIIVPGIFDHEKAVETIIKLEERLAYFCDSKEEHQMPNFAVLYTQLKNEESKRQGTKPPVHVDCEYIKKQIVFLDSSKNTRESAWQRFWNNLKYILNI